MHCYNQVWGHDFKFPCIILPEIFFFFFWEQTRTLHFSWRSHTSMKLGEAIHREQSVAYFTAFKEMSTRNITFFKKRGWPLFVSFCLNVYSRLPSASLRYSIPESPKRRDLRDHLFCCSHFIDEKTGAQRNWTHFPRSHSQKFSLCQDRNT